MKTMKPAVVLLLLALVAMLAIQAAATGGSGDGKSGKGDSKGDSKPSNGGSSGSGGDDKHGSGSGSGSGSGHGSGGDDGHGSGSGSGSGHGSGGDDGHGSGSGSGSGHGSGGDDGHGSGSGHGDDGDDDHHEGPSPGNGGGSSPGHGGGSSPGHGGGKPDCGKKGGMCGDPKIVGGDGVMFYFHGHKDQDFCLVSDSDLHINAHFIGKRPEGRLRDFTWVQALGFVHGPHSLTIAAKTVGKWDSSVDQLELSYNGETVALDSRSWASPDGDMTVSRIGARNSVDLVIKEKMGVALTVVPITKEENRVHKYEMTDADCFAHFDMQFRFYNLSSTVNGVLGQTYQPGFVNPVQRGVAMPIMGGADRFVSSSLLATDCKMSQYTASAIAQGSAMPSFMAVCGSSGLPAGVPGGITCRR